MDNLLEKLNAAQREAVEATEGPVLIIAGAGSGKTRALTFRVAYLIQKGVNPRNILAVTFTNKAAGEMKERIANLLADSKLKITSKPNVGTFHSICVRILRQEIEKMGYNKDFNIFDTQDQLMLMKKTLKELQIDPERFKPKSVLGTISKAKNELINEKDFSEHIGSLYEEMIAKVYHAYQKKLRDNNALDFDDILMVTVKLFQKFPEVLQKYQNFFRYIMVDEYQDTNHAQYILVKLLSGKYRNLCVVGDDWQGIYSFRGANIKNILDFEKDYPDAKVVKLEQNYRSTQNILDAAHGVISKNVNRKDKKIWTDTPGGHPIFSYSAEDERDEAQFIAGEIKKKIREGERPSDFVVLYRTNAQSRAIEEAMLRNSISYRIIGGLKFYQRKEIKDIIAYLRLISNFSDVVSLERIINEPKRNIGEKTLDKWIGLAKEKKINPIEFILKNKNLENDRSKITESRADAIAKFCEFVSRMNETRDRLALTDFIQKVFSESGYEKSLADGTPEGEMRMENVRELLTVAKKYDENSGSEGLNLFLEEVALSSDTDQIEQEKDYVHLMTLHSAKGLEFKTVFIAGLEEGLFPHSRSLFNNEEMEEERRLMYVGVTRAKEKVFLIYSETRNIFGSVQVNAPSRFLEDIPENLLKEIEKESSKGGILNSFRISEFEARNAKNTKYQTPNTKQNPNFKSQDKKDLLTKSYKDGDMVVHEMFGEGRIVASQGDVITIAFYKVGLKKLSASIAPLKKV